MFPRLRNLSRLPSQILVNDVDQIVRRQRLGSVWPTLWVNHMFANMAFDHFGNEAIKRAATSRGLLQHAYALVIRLNRPLNRFDLPSQSFNAIK
jgi:hypothetical protein